MLIGALFVGWLSWLGYLALTTTRPVVLSRPQFLVSQLDVIAVLSVSAGRPNAQVEIADVFWAAQDADRQLHKLTVKNLPLLTPEEGWRGAGRYILPLVHDGAEFRVASIPRSPGFPSHNDRPRIYVSTPEALEQLRTLRGR